LRSGNAQFHRWVLEKISIIIITYNRPDDLLVLCRSIAAQQNLYLLQEVVIVNNQSTSDYTPVTDFIAANPHIPYVYKVAPSNLGVSKGRNYAIQFATAPLLFLIDDDAVFAASGALEGISTAFTKPSERPIAIVSFLVKYYSTGAIQQNVFPHKKFSKYQDIERFAAAYFVGCAHAMRADALAACGGYPTQFFYGMEEYDLSYRTLDAGYSIWYESSVVVLHKESAQGRTPRLEVLQAMWVNKTVVAWHYLPLRYVLTTTMMWSMYYLAKSKGHLRGWLRCWRKVFAIPGMQNREPVSTGTLHYLQKVEARLWY
jgi:GT2 family glycosyltransferase